MRIFFLLIVAALPAYGQLWKVRYHLGLGPQKRGDLTSVRHKIRYLKVQLHSNIRQKYAGKSLFYAVRPAHLFMQKFATPDMLKHNNEKSRESVANICRTHVLSVRHNYAGHSITVSGICLLPTSLILQFQHFCPFINIKLQCLLPPQLSNN